MYQLGEDGDSDEDVEMDIQALARQSLGPGEIMLDDSKAPPKDVADKAGILGKIEEIAYKTPNGAQRVPWVESLAIVAKKEQGAKTSKISTEDVKREVVYHDQTLANVREAFRRLRAMRIPATRPKDYFAEMIKDDQQMFKVRARVAEEQKRIAAVEERKRNQASRKFQKTVRANKLKGRAMEKNKMLKGIDEWRKERKKGGSSLDEINAGLEAILDGKKKKPEQGQSSFKKGERKLSKKRQIANEKFGFGGKKRFKKSGDRSSLNEIYSRGDGRMAKKRGGGGGFKGKGKGKGGKKGRR